MRRILLALLLVAAPARAALTDVGTFCSTYPGQCQKGTIAEWAARGTGTNTMYILEVDPATGLIPTSATVTIDADGTPGSAAPAKALQVGGTDGTNLRVLKTDTSGDQVVIGLGVAGTPAGGVVSVQGVASGTAVPISAASLPLPSGAATLAKQPALGTAGSAAADVITVQGIASMTPLKVDPSGGTGAVNVAQFGGSNVVTGTGTGGSGIPRVTVSSDSTVGLVAGSAIVGKVGIDQTTPGTTNATFETNWPTTVDTNLGAPGTSTPRVAAMLGIGSSAAAAGAGITGATTQRVDQAGRDSTLTVIANNSYSGTNVTTAAFVQLIASTANVTNTVCFGDTSGSILQVATGAVASEVVRFYVPAGGSGCYAINIPASTRISLKALDATASTGYFLYTAY